MIMTDSYLFLICENLADRSFGTNPNCRSKKAIKEIIIYKLICRINSIKTKGFQVF